MNDDELEMLSEARQQLEFQTSEVNKHKLDDDVLVCECMCISARDIREKFSNDELDLSILSQELKLGSGCSSCAKSFKQWKDKI